MVCNIFVELCGVESKDLVGESEGKWSIIFVKLCHFVFLIIEEVLFDTWMANSSPSQGARPAYLSR